MMADTKAMLSERQALLKQENVVDASDEMASSRTTDAELLGARIAAAFAACGSRQAEVRRAICQELGISPQALSGWIKTGRISKGKLPIVAKHTGQSVDYFLGMADMTAQDEQEVQLVLASRHLPDFLRAELLAHAESLKKLAESQSPPKTPKKK
jgi:transcriptional regulator with XRE-family HTH domain